MSLVIRTAVSGDTSVLACIEADSFRNAEWAAKDFLNYDCIVAELNGQIVGFLVSRQICPPTAGSAAEREILNLAVAPGYRRAGVATALLKHERQNAATHFLEVRQSNLIARELYRKLGFTELGARPNYYQSPAETAIVMTLKWC